jgi:hypothetical protein
MGSTTMSRETRTRLADWCCGSRGYSECSVAGPVVIGSSRHDLALITE